VTRPRLLDLFCGAGGAAMGYHRAGFDVVGVDLNPKVGKHYPFEFHQGDALEYLRNHGDRFDAGHASPPCQDHSALSSFTADHGTGWMLAATRAALNATGLPWVIENVGRADMPTALVLCGTEFGLTADGWWLARHRRFESNVSLWGAGGCHCSGKRIAGVYGHSDGPVYKAGRKGWSAPTPLARRLLGIDWIDNRDQLAQSIPPAYTQFIGEQIITHLEAVAA
jgi:DNA (cytosine-5)-methyltransferase 1